MNPEKMGQFYASLSCLMASITALVLLPVPIVLTVQKGWIWMFAYLLYPPSILLWGYLYGGFKEYTEGKKHENNQPVS